MEIVLIASLAGLCAAALVGALASMATSMVAPTAPAVLGLGPEESEVLIAAEPTVAPLGDRAARVFGRISHRMADWLVPTHYARHVAARLRVSGENPKEQLPRFLALQLILTLVGLVAGLSTWALIKEPVGTLALIAAPILAFVAPLAVLSGRVDRRQRAINAALPDFLDMLMVSVEAGLGFDAAVARIVRGTSGPLADEFGRTLRELAGGISRKDAFRHLSDRCGVASLDTFLLAMLQADVFGVSVGNVLRVQASELRTRRRQEAEAAAQRAPALMTFPLVACILPATLIVLITPAVLSIVDVFSRMG